MAIKAKKSDRIWALYKGDELISLGTVDEIAEETGKKFERLMFMTSPSYKSRNDVGNRLQMYEIGDDEDDE